MDEYAYEIQTPDAKGNWVAADTYETVKAYDESEAQAKANDYVNGLHLKIGRVRNIRLIKLWHNPDGEI